MSARVRTCLMLPGKAEEAVAFYVSVVPDSRVEGGFSATPGAPPIIIDFTLAGTPYQALNAGLDAAFTEAASISVLCRDQAELDRLWDALLAGGGAPIECGWLRDRFGLCWQLVPEAMPRLMAQADAAAAQRVMAAMMGMVKLDVAKLEAAFRGD